MTGMNKLEPLTECDFEAVASWLADPIDHEKVCGNVFAYPLSKEQFLNFFVDGATLSKGRLCFKYGADGKPLGMASFTRIDRKNDYGQIAFVATAPSLRSTGLGSVMLYELLALGFGELLFNRD